VWKVVAAKVEEGEEEVWGSKGFLWRRKLWWDLVGPTDWAGT